MQAAGGASAKACAAFLQQMGYREYARYLSYHFPFTHERSLLEHLRAAPWRFDQGLFKVGDPGFSGGSPCLHERLFWTTCAPPPWHVMRSCTRRGCARSADPLYILQALVFNLMT